MVYAEPFIHAPRSPGRIHRLYFGAINVGGKIFEQDRILTPYGVSPPWWRPYRHRLDLSEFKRIYAEYPARTVFVGTGWMGMMEVDPRIVRYCRRKGIELICDRTPRIVELYNLKYQEGREGLLAILHLTC
jgi:hypothetical protein